MTFWQRKKLEAAAVASVIEDIENCDMRESYADFVDRTMRESHRGFDQMDDAELLETLKKSIGYNPNDAYVDDSCGFMEKMCELGRVIREVENS